MKSRLHCTLSGLDGHGAAACAAARPAVTEGKGGNPSLSPARRCTERPPPPPRGGYGAGEAEINLGHPSKVRKAAARGCGRGLDSGGRSASALTMRAARRGGRARIGVGGGARGGQPSGHGHSVAKRRAPQAAAPATPLTFQDRRKKGKYQSARDRPVGNADKTSTRSLILLNLISLSFTSQVVGNQMHLVSATIS